MIKAAGFAGGRMVETATYNSSPITKGALFAAVKPGEGQVAPELTEEEKELAACGGCMLEEPKTPLPPWTYTLLGVRITLYTLLVGGILFYTSGRMDWINAWAYLASMFVWQTVMSYLFATRCPDLILERASGISSSDIRPWDKVLIPLLVGVGPLAIIILSAVEMRYHWPPPIPMSIAAFSLAAYLGLMALTTWAMLTNRFFSSIYRIQRDRGHKVVDKGPYAFIRHPGYAFGGAANIAIPLALGSLWALVPGVINFILFAVKTYLEDSALHEELEGYREYAEKVRYRMIPGVW